MSTQYAFYLDSTACSGCKACQVACKDKHGLEVGRRWRRVYEVSGGDWVASGEAWIPNVFAYNVSVACNHCQRPICLEVCPAGAIFKRDDGIVLIDPNRCLGCGYCSYACPYDAPQYDKAAGRMTKCTFCYDELEVGKPPTCVAACPLRVLEFGLVSDFAARATADRTVHPLPDPALTEPASFITPHREARRAESDSHPAVAESRLALKAWSLVVFTILAQMAIGAFWIALPTHLFVSGGFGAAEAERLTTAGMVTAGVITAVALVASLGHLGAPTIAYRSLTHVRSSWLSREIAFVLLFAALLAGSAALFLWGIGPSALRAVVTTAAAVAGLLTLLAMSRIYMLRTVPIWNHPFTPLSFFLTSLLLGALAIATIVSAVTTSGQALGRDVTSGVVAAALTLVAAQTALLPARVHRLLSSPGVHREAVRTFLLNHRVASGVRLLFSIAAVVGLTALLAGDWYRPAGLAACLGLALIAEVADRYLFYAAREAVRPPC